MGLIAMQRRCLIKGWKETWMMLSSLSGAADGVLIQARNLSFLRKPSPISCPRRSSTWPRAQEATTGSRESREQGSGGDRDEQE
jgi:hypothetical protein